MAVQLRALSALRVTRSIPSTTVGISQPSRTPAPVPLPLLTPALMCTNRVTHTDPKSRSKEANPFQHQFANCGCVVIQVEYKDRKVFHVFQYTRLPPLF